MEERADEVRFLVDANAGKVVPWLRALGFDTVFAGAGDDRDVLRQAEREGRVLLTRDRGLAGRRQVGQGRVRAVLLRAEHWRQQLTELIGAVPALGNARPFSRCIACNALLAPCPLERAWPRVPVYVYRTQREFHECPACGRIYWRGTHWNQMKALLSDLVPAADGQHDRPPE